MQDQYLIIVAGGSGSRMNSSMPKQFMEIGGEAVIIKTLQCFLNYNPAINIIISVHKDYEIYLSDLIKKNNLSSVKIRVTPGGETRFDSVKNGLMLVPANQSVVGIHDAARPFVSLPTIKNCFEAAAVKGNAVPCIMVNESLRHVSGGSNTAVNRSEYRVIQTPQCFRAADIKKAFEQPYSSAFTDDATVLESAGGTINLVDGNIENIKITSPYDLQIAATFVR